MIHIRIKSKSGSYTTSLDDDKLEKKIAEKNPDNESKIIKKLSEEFYVSPDEILQYWISKDKE